MKIRSILPATLALCVIATKVGATLTINTTWVNQPDDTNVTSAWSSVVSYYQAAFSESFSGETWNITCDWKSLSGSIAQGGPTGGAMGTNIAAISGAITNRIQTNVYYASALANHLAKTNYISGENLSVTFNSGTSWDFSTNSKASGMESFYATAIHEVAHGLGFISADNGATGGWDSSTGPKIFDYYLGLGSNSPTSLIGMSKAELAAAFVSGNVYWTGTNAIAGHGNIPVQIYAPTNYENGSSMSHLDYTVDTNKSLLMYPADKADLQLAYSYSATELGMWKDMGYDLAASGTVLDPIADVPEPGTIWLLLLGAGFLWKARRCLFYQA